MNTRYHNPTLQHLADANEIFDLLASHLRTMKDAPFAPYLDLLLPDLRPDLVAEIAGMLEDLDEAEEEAVAEVAALTTTFVSTHRIVTEDGKVHFVSLQGDLGYTKEDWAQGREPSFQYLGGRWLYLGERQEPRHGFVVEVTEDNPHRAYRYLDQTFTIESQMVPGNLVFYNFADEGHPILIETVKNQNSGAVSIFDLGRQRAYYEVDGYEITADGWQKLRSPKRNAEHFDERLRGNQLGWQSFEQLYKGYDPIEVLKGRQESLAKDRDYEQAERAQRDSEERNRIAQEGLMFEQEIEKSIVGNGAIASAVTASTLRTWFKQHGVDASVKVRNYSMASGLSFHLKDKSDAAQEALARISDIRPNEMGILAHNRTGQGDVLIRYPYVDGLATLLASRHLAYLEKRPAENFYQITETGRKIAAGASLSAMFGYQSQETQTLQPEPEPELEPKPGQVLEPALAHTPKPTTQILSSSASYTVTQEDYLTSPGSKQKPKKQRTIPGIWSVRFHERMPKEQFSTTAGLADANDGWYARHTGAFWFKDKQSLDAFVAGLSGEAFIAPESPNTSALSAEEQAEERAKRESEAEVRRMEQIASSFRQKAEAMQSTIDDKLDPAIGQLNPTRRRAGIAAGMIEDGQKLEHEQCVLLAMADMAEAGTLPKILHGVKHRTHVGALLSKGEYPRPWMHRKDLNDLLKHASGYRPASTRKHMEEVARFREGTRDRTFDRFTYDVPLNLKEVRMVQDILRWAIDKGHIRSSSRQEIESRYRGYLRLLDMGIETQEQWEEARETILSISRSCRPGESESIQREEQKKLRELEQSLLGRKIPGFHPTPQPIIERMLDLADIQDGDRVLEPSAGKGDIAALIKDRHPEAKLDVVEWDFSLRQILEARGFDVVGSDFLKHDGQYDKILMNPPFEKGADIDHVRHALSLLAPGGRVVAIMGEGSFFRQHAKEREWQADIARWEADGRASVEKLPEGSFKSSFVSTGVATRLVVIDMP